MRRLTPGITVVTPTIPPRARQLKRCSDSVDAAMWWYKAKSTHKTFPLFHLVMHDHDHHGAAKTRHAGLSNVSTEWVAFLDDDDEMLPGHLLALHTAALEHQADYVWSQFRITYPNGSALDGPAFLGAKAFSQWNDEDPAQTTITTLVRTELAHEAGGFAQFEENGEQVDGHRAGEDFEFTMRCRKAGGQFRHHPEVTWLWHHWGIGGPGVPGNTSGMPDRW